MPLLNIFLGGALSFLGFGLFFAGLNPWIQIVVAITFLTASYITFKPSKLPTYALMAGAGPLAALLTLFRDKNDSHFIGTSIALSWLFAVLAGSWLASKKKNNKD
jgi:hypothetical protein